MLLVPVLCAGLAVAFGPARGASAAPGAFGGMDHPTQTTGTAVLYGTSAPVPNSVAALSPRASSAKDAVAHMPSRDPRMNSAGRALQPPSPPGTPVVNNAGGATGFNGLTHKDQREAGTGNYVNTQFSLEPPDQGLCVGNGFVVEAVNDAFAVYNEGGTKLTAPTALNQFYKKSPAVIRSNPPVIGDFLSDPKCYWDPVGHRFIQTILEMDAPGPSNTFPFFQRGHVLIAVSQTSNPTGMWNLYSMDTSDDGQNGTPAHTQCPCLGDQPLLGANRDGVFINTNEFENNAQGFFNGAQLYGLGRAALESGASGVVFDHLDIGTVPTGDANLPFWGSLQPAVSVTAPRSGTEMLMTGGPEDEFQNNAPLDNRIAAWSLTGTRSLGTSHPSLGLSHVVLTSETYGLPINTGATQKAGPTPLRDALGDVDPLEKINANDSRMNQAVQVGNVLYGGVNTTVTSAGGPPRVGIAFFVVGAVGISSGILAQIINQGYVAVNGENVLFPSIGVNRAGVGAMAFTLSGPDFFPSAAYVRFAAGRAVGPIHITGPGVLPEDGFSGYKSEGSPTPGVARWGDYSAAVFGDGAVWMGNEFIPNAPRTALANWGTFVSRLPG